MSILTFNTADILRVVNHALAAKEHSAAYGQEPIGPAVWLVGDQGVYLMSNGKPADILEGGNGKSRFVAYAKGCNPKTDSNFYSMKNTVYGGDDGSDLLPWATDIKGQLDAGVTSIRIMLTSKELVLLWGDNHPERT